MCVPKFPLTLPKIIIATTISFIDLPFFFGTGGNEKTKVLLITPDIMSYNATFTNTSVYKPIGTFEINLDNDIAVRTAS